jgi:uncharacterized repeat protein (TIGR02543 family)
MHGKSFYGWYKDETFSEPWFFAIDRVTAPLTLYAKWGGSNTSQYAVIFYYGEGTSGPGKWLEFKDIPSGADNFPIPNELKVVLSDPVSDLTKTGYLLAGWLNENSGDLILSGTITVDRSITLYAKFNPIGYTVAFNSNGGSGSMNELPRAFADGMPLTKNVFTRTGYTFIGWSKGATNGTGERFNDQSTKDVSAVVGTNTLYAMWAATPVIGSKPAAVSTNPDDLAVSIDTANTIPPSVLSYQWQRNGVNVGSLVIGDETFAPDTADCWNQNMSVRVGVQDLSPTVPSVIPVRPLATQAHLQTINANTPDPTRTGTTSCLIMLPLPEPGGPSRTTAPCLAEPLTATEKQSTSAASLLTLALASTVITAGFLVSSDQKG